MTYKQYQADSAPPALQHPRWRALSESLGDAKDAVSVAAKDAARAMLVGHCPDDALAQLAAERRLERSPAETTAQHRARLLMVWEAFEKLGTTGGLSSALTALGYGTATVSSAIDSAPFGWIDPWPPAEESVRPSAWGGAWPVPEGAPGVAAWPTRFWVSFDSPVWAKIVWGSGITWGQRTATWGSTTPATAVRLVKRVIERWRPAHCVCMGVFMKRTDTKRIFWPTWPHQE